MFSIISSKYKCESNFLAMNEIKNKTRNRFNDSYSKELMRSATTRIPFDIKKLVIFSSNL